MHGQSQKGIQVQDPYSAGYIMCAIVSHNMTGQVFAPYKHPPQIVVSGMTHLGWACFHRREVKHGGRILP